MPLALLAFTCLLVALGWESWIGSPTTISQPRAWLGLMMWGILQGTGLFLLGRRTRE